MGDEQARVAQARLPGGKTEEGRINENKENGTRVL